MGNELSKEAKSALMAAKGNGRVFASSHIKDELAAAGLIGPTREGITRKGSIARSKIMDEMLNEAF